MVTKKSPRANLEDKKSVFVLLGLVMVLSMVFITLEWSRANVRIVNIDDLYGIPTDEDLIPQTAAPATPPPPPPPPPSFIEEIEIVDNNTRASEVKFVSETNENEIVNLVTTTSYEVTPEADPEVVLIFVEQMPEFNGNVHDYLSKSVRYPAIAIEHGIEGKVICQFVINRDGSVVDVVVLKGVHPSLDSEALRVVKSMPNWKPGRQNGKAVRVKCTIPVSFRLR